MSGPSGKAPDFSFRSEPYAWYVVGVLSVTSIIAFIDRQIINLQVEPIKQDLGISDTQISLLQGFAFVLFYTAMAIPLGRLADGTNRKWLIVGGMFLWTWATAACGLAKTYAQLFAARMFIGVGEATLSPAGFSMLADYFPRQKLGRAIGIFTGSSFLGTGIALLLGGFLIAALTEMGDVTLPVVGTLKTWQMTFIAVAIPSFLFLLLMLTVREPPRQDVAAQRQATASKASIGEVIAFIRANWGVFGVIYIGFSILASVQFGLGAWIPSFFIRVHGYTAGEIGVAYGILVTVLGTLGTVAGGFLCDWLAQRGYADANLRTAIIAAVPTIPLVALFPLVSDPQVALMIVAPMCFLGSMPFGAGTAAIPMISPNRMRAQLVAVYLLVANLIGPGLGPWLIAVCTDYVFHDPKMVGMSIVIVCTTLIILGTAVLLAGVKAFRRTVEQAAI
ncbi:MAG: MFS transporter [Rhodospirillaceae bacterium]|nr:MFS transporter [Rhodospirillaceae bacterium]